VVFAVIETFPVVLVVCAVAMVVPEVALEVEIVTSPLPFTSAVLFTETELMSTVLPVDSSALAIAVDPPALVEIAPAIVMAEDELT
jgi:hypothetical protein